MKNILFTLVLLSSVMANSQSTERDFRAEISTALLIQDLDLSQPARLTRVDLSSDSDADYVSIRLEHPRAGQINLLLRGPTGFMSANHRSLRSLLLVSGFFTGKESVRLLEAIPRTVIVGYQYPYKADDFARDPALIAQFLRQTPGQIALALQWISGQPWAAPKGLITAGVSLGGLILPTALHMAQKMNVQIPRTVFVCTGAHLTPILESLLRPSLGNAKARQIAMGVANLTALHDPKLHLPYLKGSFLSIRTDRDQVIPESSTLLLEDLLPVVTSVVLPGPHINPDQTEVIRQTRETILRWLNPAP
jgi:hypothetical protein